MKKKKLPTEMSSFAIFEIEYDENDKEINDFIENGSLETLVKSVEFQDIFHNDLESYHWFFDYEFNGFWVNGGKFNWQGKDNTKITLTLSK